MKAVMGMAVCMLLATALPAAPEEPREETRTETREENALRLRRVLRSTGVEVNPAVDERLDALSDRELADLLTAHSELGYEETPLFVIAASVVLLVLFVALVVAVVK